MVSANELLLNAERLLSDAPVSFRGWSVPVAVTLTVVALEQMGAFVEVLTLEKYPDAEVHMGIFGDGGERSCKAARHFSGTRSLTTHRASSWREFSRRPIFRNTVGQILTASCLGYCRGAKQNSVTLTDKQQQEQRECPDIATGHLLMHLTRTNRLKDLREYGLYQHVRQTFSDAEIGQIIELAAKVRAILAKSDVVPEPMQDEPASICRIRRQVHDADTRYCNQWQSAFPAAVGRCGQLRASPTAANEHGLINQTANLLNRFKAICRCPALPQKIFRFRRRANQFYQLAPSFPGKRGASRSSRTRDGMRWTRQRWRANGVRRAGLACERIDRRADERRFNAFAKISAGSTWSGRELWLRSLRTAKSCGPGIRC